VIAHGLEQPTRDSDGAGRASPLFGLAPGGVCRAAPVASRAVVSYTTVSPLPVPSRAIGGLFSVALSVALRRPAVSRHRTLWSSDFPRRRPRLVGQFNAAIHTRFPNCQSTVRTPSSRIDPPHPRGVSRGVGQACRRADASSAGAKLRGLSEQRFAGTLARPPRANTQCARQDSNLKPPDP
jgi:hypothetical protein